MRHLIFALTSCVALATTCSVSAAERFKGMLDDRGRPVPATLQLQAEGEGRAGTLRFDGPWACALQLVLVSSDAQHSSYFIEGAPPGRCAVFQAGYLRSRADPDGVQVELFDSSNQPPAVHAIVLGRVTEQP